MRTPICLLLLGLLAKMVVFVHQRLRVAITDVPPTRHKQCGILCRIFKIELTSNALKRPPTVHAAFTSRPNLGTLIREALRSKRFDGN